MPPVLRIVPEPQPPKVSLEQRHLEVWDNIMCCGKTYDLSDQSEQVSVRLWERQLPEEDDDF